MKKLMAVGFVWIACASSSLAQAPLSMPDLDEDAPVEMPSTPATSGVFHGNYCGVGDNGPGLPPTDALDLACMHHDSCTPAGGMPRCACNARFQRETHAVAIDRRQSQDLRSLARLVETTIPIIPCR